MSNQITPGPWRKGERVSYGGNAHGFPIYFNDDGEQVADYVYTEADADLIVAAPDLLHALELACKELHACQAVIHLAGGFDPAYVRDAQAALRTMRAAIAKARGEA